MLAYDYPLLGIFWTTFWIFLWILWFMLLFRVFADVFRSHDLGGFGKALWLIFVIILPFLGVFIYLFARGRQMGQRDLDSAQAQQQAFDPYVRQTAGTAGRPTSWSSSPDLRDRGVITQAEFDQQKAKALG